MRISSIQFNHGRLRAAISNVGLPLEGVAFKAGVSLATLYRACSGKPVSRSVATCIARAVGGRVGDLTVEKDREAATSAA